MNIAKAMETSGQALAAYLKPRENGEAKDKPPNEIGRSHQDLQRGRRILAFRQGPTSRPAGQVGQNLSRSVGSTVRRMAGEDAPPRDRARRHADKRFKDPEWKTNKFFDFVMQLYLLTTQWAQELVKNAEGPRSAHTQEGRILRPADRQRDRTSNFVFTNPEVLRETLASNGDNLVARQ